VHTAVDGNDGLRIIEELGPDAIVLDVLMPGTDGLAVCRILRDRGNRTPILMLTARHEVSDRVAGLDAGADDYLVKPFALDELLARLRALLRRSVTGGAEVLRARHAHARSATASVWRNDEELSLTKTEFDLLELLMFNAGIVVSRETIYERIWVSTSRRRRSRSTCTSATCAARPSSRRTADHPYGARRRLPARAT
jgi:two-component system response regulator MprA